MTKDEIKNRISMALKDPILQQGFEIICKENSEIIEKLTKTKELIKKLVHEFYYICELYNFATDYECLAEAEQFLKESE